MIASASLKARARELGFIGCGVTSLDAVPHAAELDDWLARGYAGTMRYLNRQASRRKQPARIIDGAVTAVMVLDNYYTPDADGPSMPPRVARYARGLDYHHVTLQRLRQLEDHLRGLGATITRSYVDAGPVPERELAQRAGLGWIGKNTMLIRPQVGSYFFIASVLTDLPVERDLPFEMDCCGTCTRCLEACPTGAFPAPRMLDATRCISYLTIEHKGPIPDEIVPRLNGWAFGCDICNEVCPWNERFAAATEIAEFQQVTILPADPEYFERMTQDQFAERYGPTPLERAGLEGMRRNVRAVIGSQPSPNPPS